MGYATGKSFNLTLSGSFTGNLNPEPSYTTVNGGSPGASSGGVGNLSVVINLAGVSITGSISGVTTTTMKDSGTIDVNADGNSSSVEYGGPTSTGLFPFDCSGSFSISIPVDEWVEFTTDTQVIDSTNGVILPTPTVSAVFSLMTHVGGDITSSISFAGQSISNSVAISTASAVSPYVSVNGSGSISADESGSYALGATWTAALPLSFPSQSATETSSDATTSAALTSSSFSISGSSTTSATYYLSGMTEYETLSDSYSAASVEGTLYPAKAFSLTGEIFALDQPFPTSVGINISRYNGDPSPTTTANPTFSASADQLNYSYSLSAEATTQTTSGPVSGGDTVTDTGGTDAVSGSVDQFEPISASTTTAFCTANNELAQMEVTDDLGNHTQSTIYNSLIRLHGYSMNALSVALANPFSVMGTGLGKWTGAFPVGEGIAGGLQTTGHIAWSSTNATLLSNIQTALTALSLIGSGNGTAAAGTLSGGNGTITLTFDGALADTNVKNLTIGNSTNGTLTVSETTSGTSSTNTVWTLTLTSITSGYFTITAGDSTITWATSPFFNMSGYRFLRLNNCVTTGGASVNRTLTIGSKTWTIAFPTSAASVVVDLLNPTSGGAASDTTDSIMAPGDPNPTLSPPGSGSDGPLWGCTYVTTLSLSGFVNGSVESFSGIDLVQGSESPKDLSSQWITTWEPRFGSMPQWGPQWSNDSDTTFNRAQNRSFILITEGRQSFECDGQSVLLTVGGMSGISSYSVTDYSIAGTVTRINDGYTLDGGPVGVAGGTNPYYSYATEANGWTATKLAPASDSSSNLSDGYLNDELPISWAYGDGVYYDGSNWVTGIGVTPGTVPVQMLISSIDFYGGCGDVFSFGGGGASPNTVYLAASKVYRSQAWGILLDPTIDGPSTGNTATLFPGTGDIQPSGTLVGTGVSDSPQGVFETSGVSLDGIEVVSLGAIGVGGATLYETTGSTGTVHARSGTGAIQIVAQNFNEAKLSRVAIKAPSAPLAAMGGLCNKSGADGSFNRVWHWYDMSGAIQGLAFWRGHAGHPRAWYPWDIAAAIVTSNPADDNPSLVICKNGKMIIVFDSETSAGGEGSPRVAPCYETVSWDDGQTWSTPTAMEITGGQLPRIEGSEDGSLYRAAYVDDGTGHNTGIIKGQFQNPGDAAPGMSYTFQKWNPMTSSLVNISVQQGTFDISIERDGSNGWIISCLEVGNTTPTEYVSWDDAGGTWTYTS